MPRLQSANNAQTTLNVNITSATTSFTVVNSTLFPNAPFRITIDAEIMEVTAINKTTHTFTVTRGQEGTVAAAHSTGATVENRWTAGTHGELADANHTHSNATTGAAGFMSSTDKTKLDGVAENANNYTHPSTHSPSIIAQDASNRFVTDTDKSNWNAKETPANALLKVEHNSFKTVKSNKDSNGIFTTVEHKRKSDDTLVRKSVLSGGTSPNYTTRTVTFYAANGTTVTRTDTFTLTYDTDGFLISEV
jgi:hypothetical protein